MALRVGVYNHPRRAWGHSGGGGARHGWGGCSLGEEEDSSQVDKALEKLAMAITQQQKLAHQAAEKEEKKQLAAMLKEAVSATHPDQQL